MYPYHSALQRLCKVTPLCVHMLLRSRWTHHNTSAQQYAALFLWSTWLTWSCPCMDWICRKKKRASVLTCSGGKKWDNPLRKRPPSNLTLSSHSLWYPRQDTSLAGLSLITRTVILALEPISPIPYPMPLVCVCVYVCVCVFGFDFTESQCRNVE